LVGGVIALVIYVLDLLAWEDIQSYTNSTVVADKANASALWSTRWSEGIQDAA